MNMLITGVQNVVKESVVKIALERLGSNIKMKVLSFSDFVEQPGGSARELSMLKDTQQKLKEKIQLRMLKAKSGEHVIINGYFTVKTNIGYVPIISRKSIEAFKPDVIVHIDVDPRALDDKLDDEEEFRQHQAVERACAAFFAAYSSSGIKMIGSGPEGSRQGADELYRMLKSILVVK